MISRSVTDMKKYLTPMMFRLRGKNAGIFCAAIRRLLMIGELESCAKSQAEVSVRTLIEAIQLPQARSFRDLFMLVEMILTKAEHQRFGVGLSIRAASWCPWDCLCLGMDFA